MFRTIIVLAEELMVEKSISEDRIPELQVDPEIRGMLLRLQAEGVEVVSIGRRADAAFTEQFPLQREWLQMDLSETVVLLAEDASIHQFQDTGAAIMAYANPFTEERQSLSGADMIVEGFEEVDYTFILRIYQRKHNQPWTIAETERCILREITVEDLEELYPLYQGKDITKYMEPLYDSRQEEEDYTRAYIENMYRYYGYGMWIVVDKNSGKVIGRAGLNNQDFGDEVEAEMGYVIAADYQHQGYATEVCRVILTLAKAEYEFSKVNCLIDPENAPSIGLAKKLGMTDTGKFVLKGKMMDRYVIYL